MSTTVFGEAHDVYPQSKAQTEHSNIQHMKIKLKLKQDRDVPNAISTILPD